jgi:hypothetical protein
VTDFKSLDFWIAVAVALVVKIKTSAQLGAWQVLTTIAVAVGAAWIGSDYAAEVFGVPLPVATAIVTLTAEGLMRWLLIAVNDPRQAIRLWREWRKP